MGGMGGGMPGGMDMAALMAQMQAVRVDSLHLYIYVRTRN